LGLTGTLSQDLGNLPSIQQLCVSFNPIGPLRDAVKMFYTTFGSTLHGLNLFRHT